MCAHLFGGGSMTVKASMWQETIVEVALFIQTCCAALTDFAGGLQP